MNIQVSVWKQTEKSPDLDFILSCLVLLNIAPESTSANLVECKTKMEYTVCCLQLTSVAHW